MGPTSRTRKMRRRVRSIIASVTFMSLLLPSTAGAEAEDPAISDLETYQIELSGLQTITVTPLGDLVGTPSSTSLCIPVSTAGLGSFCLGSGGAPDLTAPFIISGPGDRSGIPGYDQAMGWLVDEALETLPGLLDIPDDRRLDAYGRPQVHAYVHARLIAIIDRYVFGLPLTDQETRVIEFVNRQLADDDKARAEAAWQEYQKFTNNNCAYAPPTAPSWVPVSERMGLPSAVSSRCRTAQSPLIGAFDFLPPVPSVEHFRAWGAYRTEITKGLSSAQGIAVRDQIADATRGIAFFLAIGTALAAAGITSALVGASAAAALAVSTAIGSMGVIKGSALVAAGVGAATVGSIAAFGVVATVLIAAIILGVAIWQLVEADQIGRTLNDELKAARTLVDPLGLDELRQTYTGQPYRSYGTNFPLHHGRDVSARLMKLVVEGDSIRENGTLRPLSTNIWTPNGTTTNDYRFRVGGGSAFSQIRIDQPDGDLTVRFSKGWMITSKVGSLPTAALSFTYVNPQGQKVQVSRAPVTSAHPQGGFILLPLGDTVVDAQFSETLTFNDADSSGAPTTVRLVPEGTLDPGSIYPAAVGALIPTRPVLLRPNPVNAQGAFELSAFTTGYDFTWTVERVDPATETWEVVHTANTYGTRFIPDEVGRYRATVVMQQAVVDPPPAVSGLVEFDVSPPPIVIEQLELVDDGNDSAHIDIRVGEDLLEDDIDIEVRWPGLIGSDEPGPVTTASLYCGGFPGDSMCNTGYVSGIRPAGLEFPDYPALTDVGRGVEIIVRNSWGATETRRLSFDNPDRPRIVAPANPSPLVGFAGTTTHVQRVAGRPGSTRFAQVELTQTGPLPTGASLYDPNTGQFAFGVQLWEDSSATLTLTRFPGELYELNINGVVGTDRIGTHVFPIVILANDNGVMRRTAHILVLDVVPAENDLYRAVVANPVSALNGEVTELPPFPPVLLGGRADTPYVGDLCMRLYNPAGPPPDYACDDAATYFPENGEVLPFPFARFLPDGFPAGTPHRLEIYADNSDLASTEEYSLSFFMATGPPTIGELSWNPTNTTLRLAASTANPAIEIASITCRLDGQVLNPCFDLDGGNLSVPGLASGLRDLEVTVTDSRGNYVVRSLEFRMPTPAPSAPRSPSAVWSTSTTAKVTFRAPLSSGRSPITSYRAECRSSNGGTTRAASGTTSPLTVTALTAGKTYRCQVRATNALGNGPYSAWVNAARVAPGAPRAVSPVWSTSTRATVTFRAPSTNGGRPITGYRAVCRSSNGGTTRATSGDSSPLIVRSLTAGKRYECRVRATNAIGNGPYSAWETVVR